MFWALMCHLIKQRNNVWIKEPCIAFARGHLWVHVSIRNCANVMWMFVFVRADNGPAGSRRTGTATVHVEVQDVNDNRPIFLQNSYETSVLENVSRGTSILQVQTHTS